MSTNGAKEKMSNRKFLAIWIPVLAVVAVIVVVANIALQIFGGWVSSQLGAGKYEYSNAEEANGWDTTYYQADFTDQDQFDLESQQLVEDIEAEGIVLSKNINHALPLDADARKVTMLGRAAADPIYGGAGSGAVDASKAITAREGLENAGFEVNDTVFEKITAFASENARADIVMDKPDDSIYNVGEMPVSEYEAAASTIDQFSDAALVFIGRGGGEGGDLTQNMEGWDENFEPGQHQLELNKDEKDLLDFAKKNFETVVVLVNSSTTIEMGPIQNDPDIDSVLLIGSPGQTGFNAVGSVLTGETNPSGRTVDLWSADFTKDPTFANFGDFLYDGIDVSYSAGALSTIASNAEVTSEAPFVNYAEGIYYGYRYYETASAEGFIDYDKSVIYPFGYGLSYTDFKWELTNQELGDIDGDISVEIKVTNTGKTAGKDVVEVYYSSPYTKGGIEKSDVVLAGFAKTDVLDPGKSETITVSFPVEEMASYDYKNEKSYVLESGDYKISVRNNSHEVAAGIEPLIYTVDQDIVYADEEHRQSDKAEVTNQFDDVSAAFVDEPTSGKILNMSRADFEGTFPKGPDEELYQATEDVKAGFAEYDFQGEADASEVEMPTTGASTELSIIDLRGLEYDDPKWNELLDSLSIQDMTYMLLNGAYTTEAIPSIAKPKTVDPDGPAGFNSFINSEINGTAFPSEVVIAQTWNTNLVHEMGNMLGNEALLKGISGWYAPAVNLHRSPFAGRNFEYYSEDPFLSGQMAMSVSNGAAEKGVYAYIKHFALNDQETNRVNNGVATWANEQAIREIYLRPFEIAIKNISMPVSYIADDQGTRLETHVGATAIMSSFNRIGSTWAGGSIPLMNNVLREEWGFKGMAVTDFNLYNYMNPDQGIAAGTDLTLAFSPSKSFSDTSSAYGQSNIRNATHNVLYTVANSNAVDGMAPGVEISYTPPTWVFIQWIATGVIGALWIAGISWVVIRVRKNRVLVSVEEK